MPRLAPVLTGRRVRLRPPVPGDERRLAAVLAEPSVKRWWGTPTPEQDAQGLVIQSDLTWAIEVDGRVVGAIQAPEEDDPDYRHAGIDLFVDTDHQGQGLGTEAIRLVARYLFQVRGHHRLTIDPAAANERAIRAYARVGFRRVGVMRLYERGPDGTWHDGLLMDMLVGELTDEPGSRPATDRDDPGGGPAGRVQAVPPEHGPSAASAMTPEVDMQRITPNLWFDGDAEEAARFYASIFPDSRVEDVARAPADNPSTKEGAVLLVTFTLFGQRFVGVNGGSQFPFTEAVSFAIDCDDQAEVDRYWDALVAGGGQHGQCGWLKDRFGVSWQVVPREMGAYVGGPDPEGARRAMEAMLTMSKLDVAAMRAAYEGRSAV